MERSGVPGVESAGSLYPLLFLLLLSGSDYWRERIRLLPSFSSLSSHPHKEEKGLLDSTVCGFLCVCVLMWLRKERIRRRRRRSRREIPSRWGKGERGNKFTVWKESESGESFGRDAKTVHEHWVASAASSSLPVPNSRHDLTNSIHREELSPHNGPNCI